jgi:hypothetical protein
VPFTCCLLAAGIDGSDHEWGQAPTDATPQSGRLAGFQSRASRGSNLESTCITDQRIFRFLAGRREKGEGRREKGEGADRDCRVAGQIEGGGGKGGSASSTGGVVSGSATERRMRPNFIFKICEEQAGSGSLLSLGSLPTR